MKRRNIIIALVAIITCLCLVGCAKKVTEKHGNSFKFSLYSNSSTGYS